jgi:hypothetical protein
MLHLFPKTLFGYSLKGLLDFLLPLASLGPWTAIEHREQIFPWTGRHSTPWVILILALDMMLIFIVRNLKNFYPPRRNHRVSSLSVPKDFKELPRLTRHPGIFDPSDKNDFFSSL